MQILTSLILAAFVAYAGAWYVGRVDGNFALMLFLAVLVTGLYWLAERLYFWPKRRRAAAELEASVARRNAELRQQGVSQVDGDVAKARAELLAGPEPASCQVDIWDLRPGMCRWPHGDPDAPGVGNGDRPVAADRLFRDRRRMRAGGHAIDGGRREQAAGRRLPDGDGDRIADPDGGRGRPVMRAEPAGQRQIGHALENGDGRRRQVGDEIARPRLRIARSRLLRHIARRRTLRREKTATRNPQAKTKHKTYRRMSNHLVPEIPKAGACLPRR